MWDQAWAVIVAIVPSIGVGYLFYRVMKAIIEGDRNERLAHSRWEAEQDQLHHDDESAGQSARGSTAGGV